MFLFWQALASAAQELSDATTPIKLVGSEAKAEDRLSARHPVVTHRSEAPVDWRKVVEERIASKTKRFSKVSV